MKSLPYFILIAFMLLGAYTENIYTTSHKQIAIQTYEIIITNRTLNYLENHYTEPVSFPYLWPIVEDDYTKEGRMTSYFGYRNNPLRNNIGSVDMKDHYAVDIVAVEGARVQNVGWGTVIHKYYPRGWHNGKYYQGHPNFNGYVEILLDTGFITKNGHVYDITVFEGDRVAPGKVIARINPNKDDMSTGPHLHFGMLNPWGQPVQPLKLVGRNNDTM